MQGRRPRPAYQIKSNSRRHTVHSTQKHVRSKIGAVVPECHAGLHGVLPVDECRGVGHGKLFTHG